MLNATPLDLSRLRVHPLAERESLTRVEDILLDPVRAQKPIGPELNLTLERCVAAIRAARRRGSGVMLIYGAHLLRNGAAVAVNNTVGAAPSQSPHPDNH